MAFPLLLPLLLGGADPQVIASGHRDRIEQALSEGVRAKVEAGWFVIDVHTLNDELVVTLSKGEDYERHVVHFDDRDTYRIETDIKAPVGSDEPNSFFGAAMAAPSGGGVEIEASCGDYFLRPYLIDEHATGEFASTLVARTLATADSLVNVTTADGRITFTTARKHTSRELVVWLDRKGGVIEAQLRRFEYGSTGGAYQRMPALKKALAKTRVTAIHGAVLVTPQGRFVIDPDGSAFNYDDDGSDHGCGC